METDMVSPRTSEARKDHKCRCMFKPRTRHDKQSPRVDSPSCGCVVLGRLGLFSTIQGKRVPARVTGKKTWPGWPSRSKPPSSDVYIDNSVPFGRVLLTEHTGGKGWLYMNNPSLGRIIRV